MQVFEGLPLSGYGTAPGLHNSVTVTVSKVDNGYQTWLTGPPPPAPPRPQPLSHLAGLTEEEVADRLIDGISALMRYMNDKGAGETWKDGGDRETLREAFKVLFPGITSRIAEPLEPMIAKSETRVFESKDALLEYLAKSL